MEGDERYPPHLEGEVFQVRRQERRLLILAAFFVVLNALALVLTLNRSNDWAGAFAHLIAPILWLFFTFGVHGVLNRIQPLRDPLLFPIMSLFTGWGLLLVDRLAPNFLYRQTEWVLLGALMLALMVYWPKPKAGDLSGLRWLRRYRYTWLFAGLVLLALTLRFGVNPSGAGPKLWLGTRLPWLGGVYFQPSELLKLLAVVFLASYMAEKRGLVQIKMFSIGRFTFARPPLAYLMPLLLMWGISLTLLSWQRDLGAASLFFVVFLVMLYLASGRWEAIASGLLLLMAIVALGYLLPISQFDLVRARFDTWINPWPDAQGSSFQIVQALMSLAAGGLIGDGAGQGYPTYVPVVHSDFVLTAITEEWGLVGALVVVAGMAVLVYRGFRLSIRARHPFSSFLSAGISAFIGTQSIIIIGGITRMVPLTGVTLPFLSYGGSSLVVSSIMVGLLLKVSGEESHDA